MSNQKKKPKSMRTAFIRVTAENDTQQGKITYTYDDIKNIVVDWSKTLKLTYFMIEHYKSEKKHYHIVIRFNSPVLFTIIKNKFPYGNIESARNINASVQYLIHKNDLSKAQYDASEIFTNAEKLGAYLINNSPDIQLNTILEKIDKNEIKEHNMFDYIDIFLYSKYRTRIENALKYQRGKIMNNKNRNINVMFIQGDTGTGKTTFAKAFCDSLKYSYCVSSSSNDTLQDYKGEDVLILDDLRDDIFKFSDMLKILDNHTSSTMLSRYNNKIFIGSTIIITSYKPLDEWYFNVPNENRKQLFRRIKEQYQLTKDTITIFTYDSSKGRYKFVGTAKNTFNNFTTEKEKEQLAISKMGLNIDTSELEQLPIDIESPFD